MVSLRQYQGLPVSLQVYSMLGSVSRQQEFTELPAEPVRIELPSISSGIYFMKVRIAGEQGNGQRICDQPG